MKYIFVSIVTLLAVWSVLAWQLTPETRARQHVTEISLQPAEGWRNLPDAEQPALTAPLTSVCGMVPTEKQALYIAALPGPRGYDRVAICSDRDYGARLVEAGISPWQWSDAFPLTLMGDGGPTTMAWRMNVRELSADGAKLLVYLSHLFDSPETRPLQQAFYANVVPPTKWRTELTWVSDVNPQRRPQIEAFNRWFPECFLRLGPADPSGTGVQRNIVQTCSGVGPAILDVYGIHQLQIYVNAGILLKVTQQAREMGFGPDVTYPKAAPAMFIEGEQYCFPCNVNVRLLIYNKNLFDRYEVPYPPTDRVIDWLEFVETYGKPLTARRPGRPVPDCFALACADTDWQGTLYQAGGTIFSSDGTRCVVDSPEAVAGIRMYRDLMHTYNVMPNPGQKTGLTGQGGWGQGWMNWFGSQKIACIRIGKWALITFRRFISEQRQRFARRFPGVQPPTDPDTLRAWTKQWMIDHPDPTDWPPLRLGAMHVPRMPGRPPLVLLTQRSAAVNALHPHRDKAIKFLQYLAGEEYCQLINDGADALPGNRAYATIERQINPDWPDERDLHVLTNQAVAWGRVREISPFVDALVMDRLITSQVQRLEADPDFSPERAMRIAAKDVNDAIRKNLRDNPKLKERYDEIVGGSSGGTAKQRLGGTVKRSRGTRRSLAVEVSGGNTAKPALDRATPSVAGTGRASR